MEVSFCLQLQTSSHPGGGNRFNGQGRRPTDSTRVPHENQSGGVPHIGLLNLDTREKVCNGEQEHPLSKRTLWLMTAMQATRPTGRPPPPATPTPPRATLATPAPVEADMSGAGHAGTENGRRKKGLPTGAADDQPVTASCYAPGRDNLCLFMLPRAEGWPRHQVLTSAEGGSGGLHLMLTIARQKLPSSPSSTITMRACRRLRQHAELACPHVNVSVDLGGRLPPTHQR